MPSVRDVERALLWAGEPRASSTSGGFYARGVGRGTVIVRWRAPNRDDLPGADLAFVEAYAPILRDAGFNAIVTSDALGVRVVCSPKPAPRWSTVRRRRPLRDVG